MESGSDDEFFDAPENLSFNRSKSHATDTEEPKKESPSKEPIIVNIDVDGDSNKDISLTVIKKQELDDTNDCRCRDGNEDFLSSQAQCTLEEDNNIEGLSFTEKKLQNKNHTGCNKKKEETLSIESISIDFKKEQFSNSEQTKKILESPNSVTPVAPPRRKKKGAKKDTKQKELIVGENNTLLLPKMDPNMSSIQVNVNSQEMDLVIERGNSLNVVYNDDLMATKSDSSFAMEYSSTLSVEYSQDFECYVEAKAVASFKKDHVADALKKTEILGTIEDLKIAEKPPKPTRPEGPGFVDKPQRPKLPEFVEKLDKEGAPSKPLQPEIPERPAGMQPAIESAHQFTDEEILEQITIKNLDTGESIPLSMAEENIPECTNPLSLHILKLATEHNYDSNLSTAPEGDEDGHLSDVSTASGGKMPGKRKKLRKFLGKTVQKIKSVADEVSHQVRKGEEEESSGDEQEEGENGYIKFKHHRAKKERLMFDQIKLLQDLSGEHIGAIWTMKFSLCGKLLASAGQDNIVRVWVLKDAAVNFEEMRKKYSRPLGRVSPTGSMTSSNSTASADDELQIELLNNADDDTTEGPFRAHPFVRYHGHTSDVLDLSWSKNYFLLSSSMDKTVRLWHISRQECLCCFQHVDFVTAICFHPRDDRYFLSGSLDGKIRLWNIPEKKVALWNEIDGYGTSLVTAANFCQNGKLAVVGTYDGRCIFFDTEKLKYHTQVTVRSSRGKNARGRKISGIEPMPGEDKVLITSNDNRIRLYDLKDHSLSCKYKGLQNGSSQIRANFSHDGKLVLCGSEDKFVYIWPTHHDVLNVRKDRNEYYESFSAHDAVVTAAIFAPFPTAIVEKPPQEKSSSSLPGTIGLKEHLAKPFEIIVAADWQGGVKLYINR